MMLFFKWGSFLRIFLTLSFIKCSMMNFHSLKQKLIFHK